MAKYPITILIPLYCNSVHAVLWAKECIASALATQAHVVVYDDGSPADTSALKDEYATQLIWQGEAENHGPAYARNRAAELAFTDLIFPLDCDDVIKSEAIKLLWEEWQRKPGVPLYTDIYKFGSTNDPHFRLLDWSCKLQKKKLGIASVCVLHQKIQWESIGGWNEAYTPDNLYEDSDYNIRLFYKYCARAFHVPLVGYRQHANQRTHNRTKAAALARQMMANMWRYDMAGCCGKNKRAQSSVSTTQSIGGVMPMNLTLNASELNEDMAPTIPGTTGTRVLARYMGGAGKGKHYYRGRHTNFAYKVKHGDLVYVDPEDAKNEGDANNPSKLVKVNFPSAGEESSDGELEVERSPRTKAPERIPEEDVVLDISSLMVKDVEGMQFTTKEAQQLLQVEKHNKNRTGIKNHLNKFLK